MILNNPRTSGRHPVRRLALVGAAAALAVGLVAAGAPASAAPKSLSAGNFRLEAGGYSPVIAQLDGALPTASVADVVASANRTGTSCKPHATGLAASFCWQSGSGAGVSDAKTTTWTPQGITTSADAYGDDNHYGKPIILTSWYYSGPVDGTHPDNGVRVSFVDYSTPSKPTYRHVLLVEPYTDGAGHPDFRAVKVHAGGLLWYGDYLYVPDTSHGFRVFDLKHLWKVSGSGPIGRQADGSYQAAGYGYVLPQALSFTASTTGGYAALRFSAASLDRSTTPDSLVLPEYDAKGTGTRVVRFPLDATSRLLAASSDGYVHASQAFQVNIKSMQGAASVGGTFYVSASAGAKHYGSIWTFTSTSGPTQHAGATPISNEDLSYWPARHQLWGLTEVAGKRYVFALKTSAF